VNLWLPLQEDSQRVVLALAQHGWMVRGGEAFGVQRPAHGLRVTVSGIDGAQAEAFARVLHNVQRRG
jgi:DNA-binding transcriptional MocR family regulator